MWSVLSIIVALITILVLLRYKISIGLAMLAGALISALGAGLFGRPLLEVAEITLSDPTTWELALTIAFVSALGKIMDEAGLLALLIDSLQKLIRDTRYVIIAIPSLVGMLMVPGGAIMSAPLVGEVGKRQELTKVQMTMANLMYRHVWYLIFPLFPSMIMATQLAKISPGSIIMFNLPLAVIAFMVTFFILYGRDGKMENNRYEGWNRNAARSLLKALGPMVLAIFLALVLGVYFPLALLAGILLVFIYLRQEKDYGVFAYVRFVIKSINWPIFLAIFPIMYFKDILDVGGGVEQIAVFLQQQGVPLLVLMVAVPFIGGFFTGSNTANIGISFPLFLPMFPQENFVYYVALIYVTSVAGYLVSPLHLCLILTREYFNCEMGRLYRYFLIPSTLIVIGAVILFFFLT